MSLPWAAHGLKIPHVVRNDWQSRGLTVAAGLTCYKKLAKIATRDNLQFRRVGVATVLTGSPGRLIASSWLAGDAATLER